MSHSLTCVKAMQSTQVIVHFIASKLHNPGTFLQKIIEPQSARGLCNFLTELLIGVSDITKKKLPHENVGEPIFLATPIFRVPEKLLFF